MNARASTNRTVSPFLWGAGVDPSVPRFISLSSLLPRKLYLISSSFMRTSPVFSKLDASLDNEVWLWFL